MATTSQGGPGLGAHPAGTSQLNVNVCLAAAGVDGWTTAHPGRRREVIGILAVGNDISDRRRASGALRESEENSADVHLDHPGAGGDRRLFEGGAGVIPHPKPSLPALRRPPPGPPADGARTSGGPIPVPPGLRGGGALGTPRRFESRSSTGPSFEVSAARIGGEGAGRWWASSTTSRSKLADGGYGWSSTGPRRGLRPQPHRGSASNPVVTIGPDGRITASTRPRSTSPAASAAGSSAAISPTTSLIGQPPAKAYRGVFAKGRSPTTRVTSAAGGAS